MTIMRYLQPYTFQLLGDSLKAGAQNAIFNCYAQVRGPAAQIKACLAQVQGDAGGAASYNILNCFEPLVKQTMLGSSSGAHNKELLHMQPLSAVSLGQIKSKNAWPKLVL